MTGTGLRPDDAARLVREAFENLGQITTNKNRNELIVLLRRTLHEGVRNVLQAHHTAPFAHAAWSSIEARQELRPISRRDLRHFVRRLLRVEGVAHLPLRDMSHQVCQHILDTAFGNSPSSYKKGRAVLSSIFSHGIKQGWCDSNPIRHISSPRVKEKIILPLSAAEVARLEKAAALPEHRCMLFSLRLMLYSGIRPAEVSRLHCEDILWHERLVIVRPLTSKTGGGRMVPLRGMQGILKKDCIIPRNWQKRWKALRRAAGFRRNSWVPDVCRHSFASYHAARYHNLSSLQLEMGHRNTNLMCSRYIYPVKTTACRDYWHHDT